MRVKELGACYWNEERYEEKYGEKKTDPGVLSIITNTDLIENNSCKVIKKLINRSKVLRRMCGITLFRI